MLEELFIKISARINPRFYSRLSQRLYCHSNPKASPNSEPPSAKAARIVGILSEKRFVPDLIKLVSGNDIPSKTQLAAMDALGKIRDPGGIKCLLDDFNNRRSAPKALALGKLNVTQAIPVLVDAMRDHGSPTHGIPSISKEAVESLGMIQGNQAVLAIVEALFHWRDDVNLRAAEILNCRIDASNSSAVTKEIGSILHNHQVLSNIGCSDFESMTVKPALVWCVWVAHTHGAEVMSILRDLRGPSLNGGIGIDIYWELIHEAVKTRAKWPSGVSNGKQCFCKTIDEYITLSSKLRHERHPCLNRGMSFEEKLARGIISI